MPITKESVLPLKPGSNALIAIMDGTTAPVKLVGRIAILAVEIAKALGAEPEFAGAASQNRMVFVMGKGRPIYIGPIGPNDALMKLDERAGHPTGPNPLFFAVNIDWRGDPITLRGYPERVVFPEEVRVQHGEANWPDGDVEFHRERLAAETDAATSVEMAAAIRAALEEAVTTVAEPIQEASKSILPWIVIGGGIALGVAYWLKKK